MDYYYILVGHHPLSCPNILAWASWYEKAERHIKQTYIEDIHISTVFLGINHAFGGTKPILFETMIFGGKHDQYQTRCATWEEAEAMHKRAVYMVEQTVIS